MLAGRPPGRPDADSRFLHLIKTMGRVRQVVTLLAGSMVRVLSAA